MKSNLFLFFIFFIFLTSCKENEVKNLEKKINYEIAIRNEYYAWFMHDTRGLWPNLTNGSMSIYGPKIVDNFFWISKIKLTEFDGGCTVEGLICNNSSFDIDNIKIDCAFKNTDNIIRSQDIKLLKTLKTGSANFFSVKVDLRSDILRDIMLDQFKNSNNLPEEKKSDVLDTIKDIGVECKEIESTYNYDKVGICIAEYVIHYKSFSQQNDSTDLTDTIKNNRLVIRPHNDLLKSEYKTTKNESISKVKVFIYVSVFTIILVMLIMFKRKKRIKMKTLLVSS